MPKKKETSFTCSNCQKEYPAHEQYNVDGRLFCSLCATWLTTNCIHCDKRMMKLPHGPGGVPTEQVCADCRSKGKGQE